MYVLSSPLFNCYIKTFKNIVKVKLTRLNIENKISKEIIPMIRFSDDILVIAESEKDIQRGVKVGN